jgi:hypothetical protein
VAVRVSHWLTVKEVGTALRDVVVEMTLTATELGGEETDELSVAEPP